jgi:hypothetical protein
MLLSMVSVDPGCRPSAFSVAHHVQSILNEFTIVSLDPSLMGQDVILLRVEAEHEPDSLSRTILAIQQSAQELGHPVQVVQYGLRSSNAVAIMEFALSYHGGPGSALVSALSRRPSILKVRQVMVSKPLSFSSAATAAAAAASGPSLSRTTSRQPSAHLPNGGGGTSSS